MPETATERAICADPLWREGIGWGVPRPGHQEGAVGLHIADVLANVEREATTPEERRRLRLVALLHDSFKFQVDALLPRVGENHHAWLARRFAARYVRDPVVLELIELHDEAYHCWRIGHYRSDWSRAEARVQRLLARLGPDWLIYLRFFRADTATVSKSYAPVLWFERVLREYGYAVPDDPLRASGGPTGHVNHGRGEREGNAAAREEMDA